MSPEGFARSWVLPVLLAALVVLSGCAQFPMETDQADRQPETQPADEQERDLEAEATVRDGWIELTLTDGEASYAWEDAHLSLTGPEGREIHKLCATAELGEDGCKEELSGEWESGEVALTPCLGEGLHHIELHLLGTQALSEGVTCEQRASESNEQEDTGPEQAAASAKGVDLDDNGDVEWIQVTLTSGESAPYAADEVDISVTDPNGATQDFACDAASAGCEGTSEEFQAEDGDEWDVGENLWVPCQVAGDYLVTFDVKGETIVDTAVNCDEGTE